MDRHTANSGKKSTKTANITRCLHDFEKPRLFFRMNTFTRSRLTKIKVIFIIDRAKCFHSFKVREEPHNLKLALCIVSGEVEYACCGLSWCDYFIVYTSKELSVLRIMFDQDHWDTLLEKLCYYYLSTFFQ